MSSTYPSDSPSSRAWWSLSPKQSAPHGLHRQLSEKSTRSNGLNSLAAAFGLKTKKHSIPIQDHPNPTSRPSVPAIITKTVNRPPSKSVSSMRSQADSPGPPTPRDPQRDDQRQSLLTISDIDPFAARVISSAPHTPSDTNRLSDISNPSASDIISKQPEQALSRVSYTSSSHPNISGSDLSAPLSPASFDGIKYPKHKRSLGSLHRKQSLMSGDRALGSAWESLSLSNKIKDGPSTVLPSEKNRFSQPEATSVPRPAMRARGMTDSSMARPSFPPQDAEASTSSLSHMSSGPRVIIRQPSVSRIGLPPSAPPTQKLPPPPLVKAPQFKADRHDAVTSASTNSASSSSVSFTSSLASQTDILVNQRYIPRKKETATADISISLGPASASSPQALHPPMATHSLKKATSHHALGRRPPPSTISVPLPHVEVPAGSKFPRKQHSFTHPKLPLPPLSPVRSSTSAASTSVIESLSPTEQKRGNSGGLTLPGRKRLFSYGSNTRRPSTSQAIPTEDDSLSILSVRSFPEQGTSPALFKPLVQPLSPTPSSSFWDEGSLGDQTSPKTRVVSHEYTPQHIMTPAEMAKLEASVDESASTDTYDRKRALSILSTSTTMSMLSNGGLVTPPVDLGTDIPPLKVTSKTKVIARSPSLIQTGLSPAPRRPVRPSTSQATVSSPTLSERSSPISPTPSMTSLPPPPRKARPRVALVEDDSNPPSLPLLPSRVRPQVSVEKALHRKSIMRKPSFLEINDSDEYATDLDSPEEPFGSFLDLARESFDTSRSISE
ncbi:hypothetical protein H0H93_014203 [Arthromyces matolae]|nr:hypothetical protein H0H93_014203 [Arthromyces matolae]